MITSQKNFQNIMKPEVSFPYYRQHATVRILSHINSFQALPSYFLRSIL